MDRQVGTGESSAVRVHGLIGNFQVNRRSLPGQVLFAQDTVQCRPATHRQYSKTMQASSSPSIQRAALQEVLTRPKSERTLSPPVPGSQSASVPTEVRGFSREQTEPDRRQGYFSPQTTGLTSFRLSHSGGQLPHAGSPGSPSASPQVPVKRAMISPPPPTSLRYQPLYNSKLSGQRYQGLYVPQDFGSQNFSPPNSPQQKHQVPQLQGDPKEPSSSSAPRGLYTNRTASTKALNSSTSASSLQACLQHNFLVEDARIRERSWDLEDPFYKLRQEIQTQCKLHAEMIRAEVSSLCNETGRRLREEIAKLQDARDEEFAQVHAMVQKLDGKVRECQQKFADTCSQESAKLSVPTALDLQVFRKELEAERMCRSDRINEVHDRIHEEMTRVTQLIEQNRTASLEAIALERSARSSDAEELRVTLESMWNQAATTAEASCVNPVKERTPPSPHPRPEEISEISGDPEDIYTLYEMAREALGDTVHLRQLVTEERSERMREISSSRQQMDVLSRELNTVQALLREATVGGKACMPTASFES